MTKMGNSCIFSGMSTMKEKQREAFRDRLVEAVRSAGLYGHGMKAELSRYLTEHGQPISEQGVKRWFDAGSIPKEGPCRLLAKRLGVPYEWLRYGRGPVEVVNLAKGEGQTARIYRVPVLAPTEYLAWHSHTLTTNPGNYVRIQDFLSDDAFAFVVNDSSAIPFAGKGMKIVVNPDDPELLDPVSAKKQIVILDQGTFLVGSFSETPYPTLEPANQDFQPIKLSDTYRIVGVLAKIAEHNF